MSARTRAVTVPLVAALAKRLTDAVDAWQDRDDNTLNIQGNLSRRIERGNQLARLATHAAAALAERDTALERMGEDVAQAVKAYTSERALANELADILRDFLIALAAMTTEEFRTGNDYILRRAGVAALAKFDAARKRE